MKQSALKLIIVFKNLANKCAFRNQELNSGFGKSTNNLHTLIDVLAVSEQSRTMLNERPIRSVQQKKYAAKIERRKFKILHKLCTLGQIRI